MNTILNVGCGMKKPEGHFGIDKNPRSVADLVHDLNETPWPVEDSLFTEVHCHAVLEHLENSTNVSTVLSFRNFCDRYRFRNSSGIEAARHHFSLEKILL